MWLTKYLFSSLIFTDQMYIMYYVHKNTSLLRAQKKLMNPFIHLFCMLLIHYGSNLGLNPCKTLAFTVSASKI